MSIFLHIIQLLGDIYLTYLNIRLFLAIASGHPSIAPGSSLLPQPMGEMMGEMMIGVMMVKGVSAWKVSMRKMIRLLNPKKSQ